MTYYQEFQVQLINDICTRKSSSFSDVDITYQENDYFDKENSSFDFTIEFDFHFNGDTYPIYITIEGNHRFYEDAGITFFGEDGVKLDFKWIEKNDDLKKKFVDCLVSDFNS